jgi:hypothetical protein
MQNFPPATKSRRAPLFGAKSPWLRWQQRKCNDNVQNARRLGAALCGVDRGLLPQRV